MIVPSPTSGQVVANATPTDSTSRRDHGAAIGRHCSSLEGLVPRQRHLCPARRVAAHRGYDLRLGRRARPANRRHRRRHRLPDEGAVETSRSERASFHHDAGEPVARGGATAAALNGRVTRRAKKRKPRQLAGLSEGHFVRAADQPAAFTMSKIGRYMATTMPPTTTPRKTIITGSMSARRPETAASTSSS
jgi:hypothetical protein